jgi:hypothetical protein
MMGKLLLALFLAFALVSSHAQVQPDSSKLRTVWMLLIYGPGVKIRGYETKELCEEVGRKVSEINPNLNVICYHLYVQNTATMPE